MPATDWAPYSIHQSSRWYSWYSSCCVHTAVLHIASYRPPCPWYRVSYRFHFLSCSSSKSKVLWLLRPCLGWFLCSRECCWAKGLRNIPVSFRLRFEDWCIARFLIWKCVTIELRILWFRLQSSWSIYVRGESYPVSSFLSSFCSSERMIWMCLFRSSMPIMISFLKRDSASYMSSTSMFSRVSFSSEMSRLRRAASSFQFLLTDRF